MILTDFVGAATADGLTLPGGTPAFTERELTRDRGVSGNSWVTCANGITRSTVAFVASALLAQVSSVGHTGSYVVGRGDDSRRPGLP